MKRIKEDAPTVAVGTGNVAGLGVNNPSIPNQAEPGVKKKKRVASFISFIKRK